MKKFSEHKYAVIGLGFGDEGKGVSVNSLCKYLSNPLVIRYSGGQQAGHTVTLPGGKSHVFSNFGSGTLRGVPTYWSNRCTFDPVGVVNEYNVLGSKGIIPKLYIDRACPITTPYEKAFNRQSAAMEHGTCGVGVGATFAREESFQSLLAGDLLFPSVFRMKMKLIKEFYKTLEPDLEGFFEACEFIMDRVNHSFHFTYGWPMNYHNWIFESSQGLLLDQNIGFFPHVTRSRVGTAPICEMIRSYDLKVFLVTRAFQTRHGNGPMTNEFVPHNIKDNPNETNVMNAYQGAFKKAILDLDLLRYGMDRDPNIGIYEDKELVITCLDLVENEYRYTLNGEIVAHTNEDDFVKGISEALGIKKVHRVRSPDGTFNPFELEEVANG